MVVATTTSIGLGSAVLIRLIRRRSARPVSRSTKTGQRSRADAGSTHPSALPASTVVVGSALAQHGVASCQSQRAQPAPATTERRPVHGRSSVLWALPQPQHAASAAADLAAAHEAMGGVVLSIEGARTSAHAISTGAVAVFRAFQPDRAGARGERRPQAAHPGREGRLSRVLPIFPAYLIAVVYVFVHLAAVADFCRRLAQRVRLRVHTRTRRRKTRPCNPGFKSRLSRPCVVSAVRRVKGGGGEHEPRGGAQSGHCACNGADKYETSLALQLRQRKIRTHPDPSAQASAVWRRQPLAFAGP